MGTIKDQPKAERIAAAKSEFASIDEYARGPAISTLSSRYNISRQEAAEIVDEPMYMIAKMRQEADKAYARGKPCHYCGLPAIKTNFFNAPVCATC